MKNDLNALLSQISQLDGQLTAQAAKSIDRLLTIRNWLIGGYLFEYEQHGSDRANYGSKLELTIAESLNRKGLSERNLKLFKQFYVVYPQIMQSVSAQFSIPEKIERTTSALSPSSIGSGDDISKLIDNLSFSHLTELMKITNKDKRQFYEIQAIKGTWSVRDLRRQISNQPSFERVLRRHLQRIVLFVHRFEVRHRFQMDSPLIHRNANVVFQICSRSIRTMLVSHVQIRSCHEGNFHASPVLQLR